MTTTELQIVSQFVIKLQIMYGSKKMVQNRWFKNGSKRYFSLFLIMVQKRSIEQQTKFGL
jgi:hypothetical protein